jgi:hypothetical protein
MQFVSELEIQGELNLPSAESFCRLSESCDGGFLVCDEGAAMCDLPKISSFWRMRVGSIGCYSARTYVGGSDRVFGGCV